MGQLSTLLPASRVSDNEIKSSKGHRSIIQNSSKLFSFLFYPVTHLGYIIIHLSIDNDVLLLVQRIKSKIIQHLLKLFDFKENLVAYFTFISSQIFAIIFICPWAEVRWF